MTENTVKKASCYADLPEGHYDFIENHLDVSKSLLWLECDILQRWIDNEDVTASDYEHVIDISSTNVVSEKEVIERLHTLEVKLYNQAIDAKEYVNRTL